MALDEATAQFLKQLGEAGSSPLHELTLATARTMYAQLHSLSGQGPPMARAEDVTIESEDGASFPARVLTPTAASRGVIVYYHGGGWTVGSIDDVDAVGRHLAERTNCTVVLVGYRLAPEHRFPAAPRDAYAALCWAAAALPGQPIVVAGDSAGGNLSALVARRARDDGGPVIDLQVLIYPATDCDLDRASYHDPANQLLLDRHAMVWFWDHYVPDPAQRADPDASPLRAADLSGLPPAVFVLPEHDVLSEEGEAYAERLRQAGVPVQLQRAAGQMHAFFPLIGALPGSAAALTRVAESIDAALYTRL
ncbi:alpha/beta hydrolase [Phytohabitans rumicis]